MSSPYEPPADIAQSNAGSHPPESGYLVTNFVVGLAGLIQMLLALLGALGVLSYAFPTSSESHQANVAALGVLPISLGLSCVSALVYRAMRTRVYPMVWRWCIVMSVLPLVMVVASFLVALIFDGPPMF